MYLSPEHDMTLEHFREIFFHWLPVPLKVTFKALIGSVSYLKDSVLPG